MSENCLLIGLKILIFIRVSLDSKFVITLEKLTFSMVLDRIELFISYKLKKKTTWYQHILLYIKRCQNQCTESMIPISCGIFPVYYIFFYGKRHLSNFMHPKRVSGFSFTKNVQIRILKSQRYIRTGIVIHPYDKKHTHTHTHIEIIAKNNLRFILT